MQSRGGRACCDWMPMRSSRRSKRRVSSASRRASASSRIEGCGTCVISNGGFAVEVGSGSFSVFRAHIGYCIARCRRWSLQSRSWVAWHGARQRAGFEDRDARAGRI